MKSKPYYRIGHTRNIGVPRHQISHTEISLDHFVRYTTICQYGRHFICGTKCKLCIHEFEMTEIKYFGLVLYGTCVIEYHQGFKLKHVLLWQETRKLICTALLDVTSGKFNS